MKNNIVNNKGLLPLGLIVSLSLTLTGFEYMSAERTFSPKSIVCGLPVEPEIPYLPDLKKPELPKPEVPQEKPKMNPVITPSPDPAGPIVVSPVPPADPVDPITEPIGTPVYKKDSIIYDPPTVPAGFLDEFPTYEEFLKIKDKEERRNKTEKKLVDYVSSGVRIPESERITGRGGTVRVSFCVNTDGAITNVKVVQSGNPALDESVVRAVKQLPKMIPGKRADKPVITSYIIPVKIALK